MGSLYIGLVHYPCRDRHDKIVTTMVTPLDVTDIARSACTYDVAQFFLITPLPSQQTIAQKLIDFWLKAEPDLAYRRPALQRVRIVDRLETSFKSVVEREGIAPLLVGTDARELPGTRISYEKLRELIETDDRPVYVLFGTGWGLAQEVLDRVDYFLPPIWGPTDYNHLSVRAAVAIILDRLRGRRYHTSEKE
ncbi:hypothetical protein HRbin07_00594 [bacterium HR07]|nr:hypothetical protein HRbin07_00594 [bacterium HR07]